MRVRLAHPYYKEVELRNGSLQVQLQSGADRVLRDEVEDFAVSISGQVLHVVAFSSDHAVWHFFGERDLESQRIDSDITYGRGSKLVSDSEGRTHLLYLVKQLKGQGAILRHRVLTGEWSKPMMVSTHVYSDSESFSACWDSEGYLHLAYCSHGDSHLLYRVFDAEKQIWSGAVPFSRTRCRHPQLINTPAIVLVWFEEEQYEIIKFMKKEEYWSKSRILSHPEGHCSNLGYALSGSDVQVMWMQSGKMWSATLLPQVSNPVQATRDDYEYYHMILIDKAGGAMAVPVYDRPTPTADLKEVPPAAEEKRETEPQRIEQEDPKGEDAAPEEPEQDKAEQDQAEREKAERETAQREKVERETAQRDKAKEEEAKLQAAFIEQAFRIQYEWEQLRDEYKTVRADLSALQGQLDELRRDAKEWTANVRVPNLDPITQRIERLERRLLKYSREQEQLQESVREKIAIVEKNVHSLTRRVRELEQPLEETGDTGFFQRLFRRI